MTSKDFLQLHLSLLLAQYGENAVLEELSPLLGTSLADLHSRLDDVQKVGHARLKKRVAPSKVGASVEALFAEHPDKADILRQIQSRFVARTFLPELRDVRRFLDRHGQPSSSLKKRDDGFMRVARQLIHLRKDELEAILAEPMASGYSALGVISDHILGRK
jgi:hypothetical protein